MYLDEESSAIKTHLRCLDDFINFYAQFDCPVINRKPVIYPCVVVQWDGSNNGYFEDYEFVYPQDIYPMLQ